MNCISAHFVRFDWYDVLRVSCKNKKVYICTDENTKPVNVSFQPHMRDKDKVKKRRVHETLF